MKRTNALRYAILGALFGLAFPLASLLLWVISQDQPFNLQTVAGVHASTPLQWIIDTAPLFLGFFAYQAGVRQDRVLRLNQTLEIDLRERGELIFELEVLRGELEKRVNRQILQLKTAALVAREAATIRDLEELLDRTAHLISEQFGFYHTGIFLLDPAREYAVLRAASSEGGTHMLDRQHMLKVGEVGIVGHVAKTGQPRITHNVGVDAVFFDNPDLPDTRSEMSLPLKVRNQVIGVLDVQSKQPDVFTGEDVEILQVLADQIALAIDNARLITTSQESLEELQRLYRQQELSGWSQFLTSDPPAYLYDTRGVQRVHPAETHLPEASAGEQRLEVPIALRGQPLGSLVLQRSQDQPAWSNQEITSVRQTVEQVALALENARLLEMTRRTAERERIIADLTTRLWATTDIHTIVRTALQDLGSTLQVSEAILQLEDPLAERER